MGGPVGGSFSCACGPLERRSVRGGRDEEGARGGMGCEDEGRRTQKRGRYSVERRMVAEGDDADILVWITPKKAPDNVRNTVPR